MDLSIDRMEIKVIRWSVYDFETPILLQDGNGPCPLVALVNTLVLRNELESTKEDIIGQDKYISEIKMLKQKLLDNFKSSGTIGLDVLISELGQLLLSILEFHPEKANSYDVDHLLKSLPLLHKGIPVDPNILDGSFSVKDLTSSIFGVYGLKFRHGWCWNTEQESNEFKEILEPVLPEENTFEEVNDLFKSLATFDTIQDFLLRQQELEENEEIITWKRDVLSLWLKATRTQLTEDGVRMLDNFLDENQFCVLFRNNHFSTLFKVTKGELYLLLTDASFGVYGRNVNKIVWQSLNSISGKDDLFFTGDFFPVLGDELEASGLDGSNNDYELSKRLQEEEDLKMAQKMQQTINSKKNMTLNKKDNRKEEKRQGSTEKKKKSGLFSWMRTPPRNS